MPRGVIPPTPLFGGVTTLNGKTTTSAIEPGSDASNTQMPALNPRIAQSPSGPVFVENVF